MLPTVHMEPCMILRSMSMLPMLMSMARQATMAITNRMKPPNITGLVVFCVQVMLPTACPATIMLTIVPMAHYCIQLLMMLILSAISQAMWFPAAGNTMMNILRHTGVALLLLIAHVLSSVPRPGRPTTQCIQERTLAIFELLQLLLPMPVLWPAIRMATITTTRTLHRCNMTSLDLLAMLAMPQTSCTIDALATIILVCCNVQSPLLPSILPFHTIHQLILPGVLAAPQFLTSLLTAFLHTTAAISMTAMLFLTIFVIATTIVPMQFQPFIVSPAPMPTPPRPV
mmetsp:Transcript_12629/g.36743  ORF Transcript_12629/g.36743 Transcript_12629/m.36743 type:complete len:285 (-) Transcript_12629:1140-1994(-)